MQNKASGGREINGLLLTDHESGYVEKSGQRVTIRPVYEWAAAKIRNG